MWLRVLTGADAGRVVEVRGPRFTVGAGADCDLVLREAGVAPRHAEFEERPNGRFAIRDLGSETGTFVATRRIRDTTRLGGNEELCFGATFADLSPVQPRRSRRALLVVAATALLLIVPGVVAIAAIATSGGDSSEADPAVVSSPASAETSEQEETVATDQAATAETSGNEPGTTAAESVATDQAETEPFTGSSEQQARFKDDFSDAEGGWEVFEGPAGSAGYAGGSFLVRVTDSSFYATATADRRFLRPTVRLTAEVPVGTMNAGLGILCRYRDELNFDALALAIDGTAAIMHSTDGKLRVVSGGGDWRRSPAIPPHATRYRLRAECGSERLRLFVNGRPAAAADLAGRAGRIGLFVAGEAAIRFDNVAVVDRAAR